MCVYMIIPLLLVTIACVVHDGAASQPDIVSEYLYRVRISQYACLALRAPHSLVGK